MTKVKSIQTMDNLVLRVEFKNGIIKDYDFKEKLDDYPPFKEFVKNPMLFKEAKIDGNGVAVSWNENIDIPENELWLNGKLVKAANKNINVHFNKNGQGRTGIKINLPLNWIKLMGLNEDDNEVNLSFNGNAITIEKNKL